MTSQPRSKSLDQESSPRGRSVCRDTYVLLEQPGESSNLECIEDIVLAGCQVWLPLQGVRDPPLLLDLRIGSSRQLALQRCDALPLSEHIVTELLGCLNPLFWVSI
jgi:hypothetical protein